MQDERASAKGVKAIPSSSTKHTAIVKLSRDDSSVSESDWLQLTASNTTDQHYPQDSCVYELVAARGAAMPDGLALSSQDATLSYGKSSRRANQLAHRLRTLGVGHNVPVGVCTKSSLDVVVGLLGILKAGGAYVPMDVAYPADRLAIMLRETKAPVLVMQQALTGNLFSDCITPVVRLDPDVTLVATENVADQPLRAAADDLACVIYTSGSTGRVRDGTAPHARYPTGIRTGDLAGEPGPPRPDGTACGPLKARVAAQTMK